MIEFAVNKSRASYANCDVAQVLEVIWVVFCVFATIKSTNDNLSFGRPSKALELAWPNTRFVIANERTETQANYTVLRALGADHENKSVQ